MFGALLNLLANLEFQRGKMGVRQETFSFKGEANRAKEQKGAWALIEAQIQISVVGEETLIKATDDAVEKI